MPDSLFHFKRFYLHQEKSLMEITTDGVLLEAWAHCSGADSTLDIGAGTGLITLMPAQRSNTRLVAMNRDHHLFRNFP